MEEQLNVGKREVERGGVRVRTRVVERPVEEAVRNTVRHTEVDVRDLEAGGGENGAEGASHSSPTRLRDRM